MSDVTRWSAFSDDATPLVDNHLASSEPGLSLNQTAGKTYRFGPDGSSVQSNSQVNLYRPVDPSAGIVATARTAWGTPVDAYNLSDDDIVDVGGLQTSVAVARSMGLIAQDRSGRFEDAPQAAQPNTPAEPEGQDYETFTDKGAEEALTGWVSSTSPGSQIRALFQVYENGEVSRDTLTAMASEAGVEPHQMEGQINRVIAAFEKQADEVITKAGVPINAFLGWAEANREGDLRNAMTELTMQRSSKALAALAGEFIDHIPADLIVDAEFGPGISAQKFGDEAVLVIEGHGSMSLGAAVRAGLVKLSVPR